MVPEVELDKLQTYGNSQNLFLAGANLAGYRALLEEDIEPVYAAKLFSSIGWKVYSTWLAPLRFLTRFWNYTNQMKSIGSALRRYPFSKTGCQVDFREAADHFRKSAAAA